MFEFELKMDLSLSPCLQMIHSEPFSALFRFFSEMEQDKCKQVQEDRFDGLLLIVFFSLHAHREKMSVFPAEWRTNALKIKELKNLLAH